MDQQIKPHNSYFVRHSLTYAYAFTTVANKTMQ